MWMMGQYILSAVQTATDRCLNGKKARSKYIEKPIMEISKEKQDINFTEEELQRQREAFVTKLLIMKSNFDLNKKKLEEEGQ